jgi:glycosyltransferase involved in cell wall biosynthesis
MKALIISHAYDPTASPRAIRWSHIAGEWVRKGNEVDVVTAWKPGLARVEILNGVRVHRVGNAMSELWRDRFKETNIKPVADKNTITPPARANVKRTVMKIFISPMLWIRHHTWKKLWWPDSSCLWYFPARKIAKRLLLSKGYDLLISVSLPFTGHLVALNLQKKTPISHWIADTGDPFTFLDKPEANNGKLYKERNRSVEKEVFRVADAVTVTTAETSQRYVNMFPEYGNKLHVIPPLLASSAAKKIDGGFFKTSDVIRLVYVGRLYRDNRNPDFLLSLFDKLLATHLGDKLELHLLGSINDCMPVFESYKLLFNNKLYLHGNVGHAAALLAMSQADVLVNIGNANVYQLPSKVVEYAMTGKPILNLAIHDGDTSASFFSSYPQWLNICRGNDRVSPEQVEKALHFIEQRRTVPSSELEDFLAHFRVNRVAQSYEDIVSKLSMQSR